MKNAIKLKGKMKLYLNFVIYMSIMFILADIGIFMLDIQSGLVLGGCILLYVLSSVFIYWGTRKVMMNELVSFATQYGQIQRQLLRDLVLPHALMDDQGKIIWTNKEFEATVHQDKGYRKSVSTLFPEITRDKLPGRMTDQEETTLDLKFEEKDFRVIMRKISLREMAANSDLIQAEGYDGYLIALYLFDETALKIALREIDDQSLTVGLFYLDNYEEALEGVEEVRRSLLIALIDRKVNKYINGFDGICKKLEKDKYLVILRKRSLMQIREEKFDLLEDVKTVNIGNEMAVTLSIGIGYGGLTFAQNYEFARNAIDLALGRGGDQAVVKSADAVSYFGGKSQQMEKTTRVKARVKAQALREIIATKDRVLIMGHRLADVDCFGSAVGIYRIAQTLEKKANIVLNDVLPSIQPLVDMFKESTDYPEDMIISSAQALELAGNNAVLVVVDVDKPKITECPDLLKMCKSIVVLDHHRRGQETIENATLSYVEAYASSACEMVSEILQYIADNIKIRPEEADCMYSGIMIDTNNFSAKTGVRTFEAAAFLRRNGADMTRVRKLFRENAEEYKARADAVSQAEIYRGTYAISICSGEDLQSPTVVGAQAANELLNIKGVKASFVLTEFQNQIFVSARSIDEVNVQIIMERLGGGGHMNIAGCQMEQVSASEAIGILKKMLDTMIEEGAI